ncbi:MAG: hypothetical protein WD669_05835 [Pirellulales bacterium]
MRTTAIRDEVKRLIRQTPFRPFALNLENGDRVIVEHPENIAFDPTANGNATAGDFYIISSQLRVYGTFDAVTSVALVDRGE